jgi:hypothetical protein
MEHSEIFQLIIGYSFVLVIVFTALITAGSLVGWVKFFNDKQQKKLFNVLIIELILISLSFFSGLVKFDADKVTNNIIENGKQILINTPEKYAKYISQKAEFGFAYPEKYSLQTPGTDFHHGRFQLNGNANGWLAILTFVPPESEILLREEQGKPSLYHLNRHISNLKNRIPFIYPSANFLKEEVYPIHSGVAKFLVYELEISGVSQELQYVLIYSKAHLIHTFTLIATKDEINNASLEMRKIISTISMPNH